MRKFLFAHGIEFGDVNTKMKCMTFRALKVQRQAFHDLDMKSTFCGIYRFLH